MENYTKYKLKSSDELTSVLNGRDNLFVIACNKCFKEFETVDEPDCGEFLKFAAEQGKTVTGSAKFDFLCNKMHTERKLQDLHEGDVLPSVRQLAEDIGINMHTVNKAYSVLRQEGFVTIDRRRGAIVSLDVDKLQALDEMQKNLRVLLAKGRCKNITRQEIHDMVDEIFDGYDDK